jgi:DNA-binding response OmpR family regulator
MLQKENASCERNTLTPALMSEILQATNKQKKIILIVDDDEAIRETLTEIIQGESTSYHPIATGDPEEALAMVENMCPALFLLDYKLPKMSGIELYDHLHQIEGLEQVPTLLISANLPYQEISKRRIGAMKKPFELDKLLDTIEALLSPIGV